MAEARIDVQVEHKHAPPPSEKKHPNTCPRCGSHYRDDELEALSGCARTAATTFRCARARASTGTPIAGTFVEEVAGVRSDDPLEFFDLRPYAERLSEAELNTGLSEAMVVGQATIDAHPIELAVMDFSFMGGSMGSAVGEKFSRACDSAIERGVPLVSVTSSGGARMQEGILSLMQLPKTVCAVEDLHDAGLPMLTVMAHPTTAGVLASFASLGDVTIAEPGALIAFTGPRVVQQTTNEKLPDDFGLAEQNLRFGHLDAIVPRADQREYLVAPPEAVRGAPLSEKDQEVNLRQRLSGLSRLPLLRGTRVDGEADRLERQLERLQEDTTDEAIWRSVELARHQDRPYTLDYVERMLDDWVELHGDRGRADDGALVTGIGSLDGRTIVLVGHQKGRDVKERLDRQFGMAYPEGYHKAMRVMEIAERFGFPFVVARRHTGRLPGRRRRAARTGRRDRALAGRAGSADGPDRGLHHRRGRLGRRRRARRHGSRPDAGERDLLGDHARGLRSDPLAGRRRGKACGRGLQAGRRPLPLARRDRRDRARSPKAVPSSTTTRRRELLKTALVDALAELEDTPGEELSAPAARQVPRHGRLRLISRPFHTLHRVFNR